MKTPGMKKGILVVCVSLLAIATVEAQPRRGEGDRPERGRQRERMADEQRGERPRYVDQWLEQVRENDPEEYERLISLRADHPVAFRMEMRSRVQERRVLQMIRDDFPGFYAYLQGLDQEERDRLGNFLQRMAENRPQGIERPRSRFADLEGDLELRRLGRDWRQAETPDEQADIERAVRAHIEQLFDERTVAQQGEVAQLEQQLQRLRTMLETRQARREQWIAQVMRRLQEMAE